MKSKSVQLLRQYYTEKKLWSRILGKYIALPSISKAYKHRCSIALCEVTFLVISDEYYIRPLSNAHPLIEEKGKKIEYSFLNSFIYLFCKHEFYTTKAYENIVNYRPT